MLVDPRRTRRKGSPMGKRGKEGGGDVLHNSASRELLIGVPLARRFFSFLFLCDEVA